MKTIPPAISLFLIVGLAAAVVVQTFSVAQLKQRLAAAHAQGAAHLEQAQKAEGELVRIREQSQVFKSESETLRQRLATVAPGSLPPAPTAGASPEEKAAKDASESEAGSKGQESGAASMMKNVAKMFNDPEMKKVMRTQQAMGLRMMYGDLARELGLSAEETDAIIDLLADRQLGMSEKSMELMGDGGKMDAAKMEALGKAANAAREEFDGKLKEALGPERFAKFQEYEKTVGDRFMLQQYGQQFASYGAPLQDAQREGLLRIMTEEREKSPTPNPFNPGNKDAAAQMQLMQSDEAMHAFLASQEDYNRRVLDRAAAVLTPEQVNSFKTIQANWTQMMQAGMKMSREMAK